MNRADRRRAARMARRRRTGWLHRLASARSQGAVEGGKVYTSAIERDAWYDIYRRRGTARSVLTLEPMLQSMNYL